MNGHSDAVDMQIAYDIEHEGDDFARLSDLHSDKCGLSHPGLSRENAEFLDMCDDWAKEQGIKNQNVTI